MSKSKGKLDIQKDEVLQAVIVTDTFNKNFYPVQQPYCLIPLVNKPLLEYTIEHLSSSGVEEIIVFCTSHVQKIKEVVKAKEKSLNGVVINIIISDGCYSLGDVMRDIDGKAVIRSDFILVTGDIISNVNLLDALKTFKKINSLDSGAVATVMYKRTGVKQERYTNDELVIAYDCDSGRLLMHQTPNDVKKINVSMENILMFPNLEICMDISSTGIIVCSPAVPPLFSDNFDFQSIEHFIKGVLINEEILDCRLYCNVIDGVEYGAKVKDWPSYQTVSKDMIQRWVHPIVPKYKYRRNNIYLADNVVVGHSSLLKQHVVIGENSTIGEHTEISNSVIGNNCVIGSYVKLSNSFLFNNVNISDNCEVSFSVLSHNTGMDKNSKAKKGCVLGSGVAIGNDTEISGVKFPSPDIDETDDGNDSDEEEAPKLTIPDDRNVDNENWDEDESESDNEESEDDLDSPPMEDTQLFYLEVLDSLQRGYEEKLVCDNLTLEINSSRYAYNVTVAEVNFYVVKAILVIGNDIHTDMKSLHRHLILKFNYFLPLFENYIKNETAQMDCLTSLEETAFEYPNLCMIAGKLLHDLYEKDILNEEVVNKWYNTLDTSLLKKSLAAFVQWLEEADEESDED